MVMINTKLCVLCKNSNGNKKISELIRVHVTYPYNNSDYELDTVFFLSI